MGNVKIDFEQTGRKKKRIKDPFQRRVAIEKANAAASLHITAGNMLRKQKDFKEVDAYVNEARTMIKDGEVPKEVFLMNYDQRIQHLQDRVSVMEEEKDANGGFLKPGAENMLKQWKEDLEAIKKERKAFVDNLSKKADKPNA